MLVAALVHDPAVGRSRRHLARGYLCTALAETWEAHVSASHAARRRAIECLFELGTRPGAQASLRARAMPDASDSIAGFAGGSLVSAGPMKRPVTADRAEPLVTLVLGSAIFLIEVEMLRPLVALRLTSSRAAWTCE